MALHVLGAGVTAALFGAILGGIGSLLGAPWGRAGAVGVAVVALVYALGELPRVGVAVPQLRRQVPDWWRTYFGPSLAAFLYGAGLGVGFLTFLAHGTLVVVAAAAVAIGEPAWGAVIVGAFGIARGAAIVVAGSITTDDDGAAVLDRLLARSDRVRRRANGAALVAVGVVAIAIAARTEGGWPALASAIVAATFAWSAIAKLASPRRWVRALEDRRLPRGAIRAARRGVPAAEALVPLLAVLGFRRASAVLALGLLVAFSIEIVRVRLTIGPGVACGCFGERTTTPTSVQLLRNASLSALATLAAASAIDAPLVRWPGVPHGADVVPAVLAVVGTGRGSLRGVAVDGVARGGTTGMRFRRLAPFLVAALVVAGIVAAIAVAGPNTVQDGNDTRGVLDVKTVRWSHPDREPPTWKLVTFDGWSARKIWDRGYLYVLARHRGRRARRPRGADPLRRPPPLRGAVPARQGRQRSRRRRERALGAQARRRSRDRPHPAETVDLRSRPHVLPLVDRDDVVRGEVSVGLRRPSAEQRVGAAVPTGDVPDADGHVVATAVGQGRAEDRPGLSAARSATSRGRSRTGTGTR